MDSEELNIAVANEAFAENKVYMLEKQLKQANDRIKLLEETLEAVTDKLDNAWGIYMEFKEAKP